MTHTGGQHDPRLMDLLADNATEGLDTAQRAELDALLRSNADLTGEELDVVAAMLDRALAPNAAEQMPAALRERLNRQADVWNSGVAPPAPKQAVRGPLFGGASARADQSRAPGNALVGLAWLAAAACLTLAIAGWWPRIVGSSSSPEAFSYERIAALPDAVRIAWQPGPDETGAAVGGEVVWSNSEQAGYMTFRNLKPLDPSKNQYQLWIFDGERQTHPVDGGVFDIDPRTGEARVRIDAKLRVYNPTLFAITVEPPGGVVVSDQSRIAAIAKPS